MKVSEIVRLLIMGKKSSSQKYVQYLRSIGMVIGERTTIFSPMRTIIDEQYPWLIEIGNNVQITAGVSILTHDFSWSVIKNKYGPILGCAKRVIIGNNVFIGVNSTILGGGIIGDNTIIGAGSVVSGIIPENSVAVGNPCKVICSLEEYMNKRVHSQNDEATNLARAYYSRTGQIPPKDLFHEFFFLFDNNNELIPVFEKKMRIGGSYNKSLNAMSEGCFRQYDDYMAFINDAIISHDRS